jgi:hypothetical protein
MLSSACMLRWGAGGKLGTCRITTRELKSRLVNIHRGVLTMRMLCTGMVEHFCVEGVIFYG